MVTDLSQIGTTKPKPGQSSPVPGFYVNYTDSNAREAQQICNELTSLLLEENLKSREDVARGTTDFLSKQVEDTKHNLDDLDSKLAAFKKQYMGQLPGDEDNNLKILMGLNSQLDANTQSLSRAQQDKAYTESLLAQQVAAWKNSRFGQQSAIFAAAACSAAVATHRLTRPIHRRPSGCDQDQGGYRPGEKETG